MQRPVLCCPPPTVLRNPLHPHSIPRTPTPEVADLDDVVSVLEEILMSSSSSTCSQTFEAWLNTTDPIADNSSQVFQVQMPGALASAVPVIGFAHQMPTGVDAAGVVIVDEFVTVTVTNNSGGVLPIGTPVLVRARI